MSSPEVIQRAGPLAVPYTYTLGATEAMRVKAAFVRWDGTGASGDFYACLSFYAQNGALINRVFPTTTITAGDVADVSYAPFPGGMTSAAAPVATVNFMARLFFNPSAIGVFPNFTVDATCLGGAESLNQNYNAICPLTFQMPATAPLSLRVFNFDNVDRDFIMAASVQRIGAVDHEVLNSVNPTTVLAQSNALIPWENPGAGSTALLDLTTPTVPTIVTTDRYAVTVMVQKF